jgi:hypothetical protein
MEPMTHCARIYLVRWGELKDFGWEFVSEVHHVGWGRALCDLPAFCNASDRCHYNETCKEVDYGWGYYGLVPRWIQAGLVDGTITALSAQANNAYRDHLCPFGKEKLKIRSAAMLHCVVGQVVGRSFGDPQYIRNVGRRFPNDITHYLNLQER